MLDKKYNKKDSNYSAFSLIELSIVLIIIGLLVAGVVAGQRVISAARISTAKSLTESSPVTAIKGLSLWLETTSDASFINSDDIENDDPVEVWRDINPQSQKNNFVTANPTGTNKNPPSYNEETLNSLPAITFYAEDSESLMSTYDFEDLSTTSFTFFVVANFRTGTTDISTLLHQTSATGASILHKNATTGTISSSLGGIATTGAAVSFTPQIYTLRYKYNGLLSIYTNGGTPVSESPTIATVIGEKLLIGEDKVGTSTSFFNGNIGEIIYYNRRLRKTEVDDVHEYLSQKWKISVTDVE